MSRLDEEEARSQTEAEGQLEQALERSLELDRSRLATHRRIVAGDQSLKARRMVSDSDALKSQSEADEVESSIAADEARLHQIAYDRVRDETTRRRASLKRKLAVREAETRLALLQARFERDTRIVSPYAGKVVDLLITPHAPVQMGTPAVLLRPAEHRVRGARGDHLRAGGTGQEDPGRRRRRGRAGHRPAAGARIHPGRDPLGLRDALHRPGDAGRAEAPRAGRQLHREVPRPGALDHPRRPSRGPSVDRVERAASPLNRLDWSSSSGAYQPVSSGTLCSASIVVERRPLIALAMPWFKGLIGID